MHTYITQHYSTCISGKYLHICSYASAVEIAIVTFVDCRDFLSYVYVTHLFIEIDTFYFNQSTFVAAENRGYVLVNLTFSISLRHDTVVQFRYDDLIATCKFFCLQTCALVVS